MTRKRSGPLRIAVVIDMSVKSGRERWTGILRYAARHDDFQPILMQNDQAKLEPSTRRRLSSQHIDGFLIACIGPSKAFRSCIRQRPFVKFERDWEDCPATFTSVLDNRAIGRSAGDFLLRRGYRNFAYIGPNSEIELQLSEMRFRSFSKQLAKLPANVAAYNPAGKPDDAASLAHWLKTLPKPCGIFVYADNRAKDVITACHAARIPIPDQVSIVSVDNDIDICENTQPTLTSIWPDFEDAGYAAAQTLHQCLMNPRSTRPRHKTLPYGIKGLVERSSTQDLRGGGRLASLATEIIRKRYREDIRSTDIARELHVSRRLLDLRYREITGTSLHAAIENLRMQEARSLLCQGERSILEIATCCGYNTVMAFRNAFRRTFGTTSIKGFRLKSRLTDQRRGTSAF